MIWLISANSRLYDHASSFATNGYIDWRQRARYEDGDIVYIYCTRPLKRVMYKCEVIAHSMAFSQCTDDAKFWIDKDEYEKSKKGLYARLKLIEQVDTEKLNLDSLIKNGLNAAPQGPVKVSPELHSYLNKHFNDYYAEGFFTDVSDQENFHEGHVRSVMVDIYERSSVARRKCIDYHGSACIICGLDFGKRYGSLGEGFIHVHHLKPLHTIGEDYVVNYKTDLIPVCPNCHAMIHRITNGENMPVEKLQEALKEPPTDQMIASDFLESDTETHAIEFNSTTVVTPRVSEKRTSNPTKKHVGQRVIHKNSVFGTGTVTAETELIVKIRFDNGKEASFMRDSFQNGLLTLVE